MADRWYRCCFTKAYFTRTISEISLVNQSRKRESGSRNANCFIDRPCRRVERGIWKYSSVVRAKEGERIDAFSMADRLEGKFIRDSFSFNTFGQPVCMHPVSVFRRALFSLTSSSSPPISYANILADSSIPGPKSPTMPGEVHWKRTRFLEREIVTRSPSCSAYVDIFVA